EHAEQHRLADELRHDRAARRADREAQSYLARPLADGRQHHVHDADASYEQGYRRDRGQEQRERVARFDLRVDDGVGVADVEIVVRAVADAMLLAHDGVDVTYRVGNVFARARREEDVVDPK